MKDLLKAASFGAAFLISALAGSGTEGNGTKSHPLCG